jgi:hypothetical protein
MSETGFDRNDLLQNLHDQTNKGVLVEFTKADGTERKMLCTLAESLIPESATPKSKSEDKPVSEDVSNVAPTVQRVYDLENSGWRSFRWDSVKFFKAVN